MTGASGRIRTCGTWYRKPVLYPLSYGGSGRRRPYNPARRTVKPVRDRNRRAPIGLAGEPRPALHRPSSTSSRPSWPTAALDLPDGVPTDGDGGAAAPEGPRRLRHQRRDAAGQEGRHQPAGPRRAAAPRGWPRPTGIAAVEVAGPGFLNITVEAGAQGQVAADIVAAGAAYGHTDSPGRASGSTSSSSRPTRPARCTSATPAGRSSATRSRRVLEAAGAEVTREFYINDRGNQMDLFGASLEAARARSSRCPRTATRAPTSPTSPQRSSPSSPSILDLARAASGWSPSARPGYALQLTEQQDQLDGFHTHFDVWFSEREPARRAATVVADALEKLTRPGPPLRRRRRAVDAHHRLRRRQGPGADPDQRRADLLRLRHRLLRQQAGARLRPLHLPARRRPPRLRRPAAGDGRLRRRRPRRRHSRC